MEKYTVLVTGGTGAIGTALCQQFSNSGAAVYANCHPRDRDQALQSLSVLNEAATAEGRSTISLSVFDVTEPAAAAEAIGAIGSVDVLVNAAGITRDSTLSRMEPENWMSVIDTNLNSVYNVTRPCIQGMRDQRFGRIINISSVNGQRGQIGQCNYAAAKAGMTGFTKSLARELARDGITVNSISPGYVESPMIDAVPQAIREQILLDIPVGRFAKPEEIAHAAGFLASRESAYITGTDLSINGGYHIG